MKQLIAIQGCKNTGKDTVALMLQYLFSTPKILHNYNYYKLFVKKTNKNIQIIKYADKIKQILSILLDIPIDRFEDRDFKENYYVDFNTLTINHINNINPENILNDSAFTKETKRIDKNFCIKYCLSIRQIMQFFGTEIMRKYFGNKLWILSTLNKIHNKKITIIADQRFIIENQESKDMGFKIIHLLRPEYNNGTHPSEAELNILYLKHSYDELVNNNSNLEDLFNKCKKIYKLWNQN